MDTLSQLDILAREARDFASIIEHNPADDLDLQNACELFSNYLHNQLDIVAIDDASHMAHETSQRLYKLSELISPEINPENKQSLDGQIWKDRLSKYADQIKSLNQVAA